VDPDATYRFSVPLWRWPGESPWHFVTLPEDQSDEIDERTRDVQRGFGSVRVQVASTEHGAYVLPIKKAVRAAEGLTLGADVAVTIRVLDLPG